MVAAERWGGSNGYGFGLDMEDNEENEREPENEVEEERYFDSHGDIDDFGWMFVEKTWSK